MLASVHPSKTLISLYVCAFTHKGEGPRCKSSNLRATSHHTLLPVRTRMELLECQAIVKLTVALKYIFHFIGQRKSETNLFFFSPCYKTLAAFHYVSPRV